MNAVQWAANYEDLPLTRCFAYRSSPSSSVWSNPDAAVFEAWRTCSGPPRGVLFLDDNLVNVEAARGGGLRRLSRARD